MLPYLLTSRLFTCSYLIIPCVFSAGCHLLYLSCSCMLVLTTRLSMSVYDSDLSIHVCYLCTPFGICITTRRGVLTPLDPHIQVSELWICRFSQLLQRGTTVAWIIDRPFRAPSFQAPCASLELSYCNSWAPFVLFILVYLFIFSHLRLSVM